MSDYVIGYYGVINHEDPNSDLMMGEIIEDADTVRGAANLLPVWKQESQHYAALLRQQQGEMDGLHRNPFDDHDTHLTGTVAKVRFGMFVFDTSGEATPGLIASTAYILSRI